MPQKGKEHYGLYLGLLFSSPSVRLVDTTRDVEVAGSIAVHEDCTPSCYFIYLYIYFLHARESVQLNADG